MDPRHPELSLDRIDQLVNQFKLNLDNMRIATTSAQLAQLEREGGLVVQEICLVAPRLHEAMMQTSRQRRHDLTRGNIVGPTAQIIAINESTTEEAEIVEKPVKDNADVIGEENIGGESVPVKKLATKKTTRKKKTAKKAEK